jgi:hypothetical protein
MRIKATDRLENIFRDLFWQLSLDFVFMIVHYGELVFDRNFLAFSFVSHVVGLKEK